MTDASFASLGPTLLARKGGAKPAMRRQLGPLPGTVDEEQLEDLGWNDMGPDEDDNSERHPESNSGSSDANIVPINPSANRKAAGKGKPAASPLVQRQQHELAERIIADIADQAPIKAGPQAKPQARRTSASKNPATTKNGRRAAFTLRLDKDRHLKLRLAATMQGVSAQALVTKALDAMLGEIEDLDSLAARMKRT